MIKLNNISQNLEKIAIIPARGGSKRIPNKNSKEMLGKPLIMYTIENIIDSKSFDYIIVSTDDNKIIKLCEMYDQITIDVRPKNLSDDYTKTIDVIQFIINKYLKMMKDKTAIACIYPTSIFLNQKTIQEVTNKFINSLNDKFLIGLFEYGHPIQRAIKYASDGSYQIANVEYVNTRTQDLEKYYFDSGQFYFGSKKVWLKSENLLSDVDGFILSAQHFQDLDTMEDWTTAEAKMKLLRYDEK